MKKKKVYTCFKCGTKLGRDGFCPVCNNRGTRVVEGPGMNETFNTSYENMLPRKY